MTTEPATIPPPPASGVRLREASADLEAEASVNEETMLPAEGAAALSPEQLKQIITTYLPLVQRLVRQLARRLPANVQRDDLISAGVFGLVDSLRRNGGDQGVTFEWYARTRIRGAIFDELRAQDWLSRRARDRIRAAGEGDCMAVPVMVSLDDESSGEPPLQIAATGEDPLELVELHCQQRALARAMEQLPERERQIVGRHYFDGVKLKDISVELGVSEPRISQLHSRALGRLRALLQEPQSLPRSPARPVMGASVA